MAKKQKQITKFDKSAAREVHEAALEALKPVAERFGLAVKMLGGTFLGPNFKPGFEFAVVTADGQVLDSEAEDFKMTARVFGLKPEDLGREMQGWKPGQRVKLVGYRPKGRGTPFTVQDIADGRRYRMSESDLKLRLQAAEAATAKPAATHAGA